MSEKRSIGRGLAAILSTTDSGPAADLRTLPLDLIDANPNQPRKSFNEAALLELAESLKSSGLVQPIVVRPVKGGRYQLIAGERRFRAAQLAGLSELQAIVRVENDVRTLEMALIENVAREDLNPVETASACLMLVDELGLTREQVGLKIGKSRAAVSNLIRLLELPDVALEALSTGALSEGHGRALLMADDHSLRAQLTRTAIREQLSVRTLEQLTRGSGSEAAQSEAGAEQQGVEEVGADEQHALDEIKERFQRSFGVDVTLSRRAKGGYALQLRAGSFKELQSVVDRFGV